MTNSRFSGIAAEVRAFSQKLLPLASAFWHGMLGLPLPALLLACVGCALLLTILPLALGLFVAFLVVKLGVSLLRPAEKTPPSVTS